MSSIGRRNGGYVDAVKVAQPEWLSDETARTNPRMLVRSLARRAMRRSWVTSECLSILPERISRSLVTPWELSPPHKNWIGRGVIGFL
jgi:hypothetical protein